MNDCVETLFIEIDKEVVNSQNNMIVGVIYPPPGTDISTFNDQMSTICARITRTRWRRVKTLGQHQVGVNLRN